MEASFQQPAITSQRHPLCCPEHLPLTYFQRIYYFYLVPYSHDISLQSVFLQFTSRPIFLLESNKAFMFAFTVLVFAQFAVWLTSP